MRHVRYLDELALHNAGALVSPFDDIVALRPFTLDYWAALPQDGRYPTGVEPHEQTQHRLNHLMRKTAMMTAVRHTTAKQAKAKPLLSDTDKNSQNVICA